MNLGVVELGSSESLSIVDNFALHLLQLQCVVGLAIGFLGVVYWYVRVVYLPRRGGYKLEAVKAEEDGISRTVLRKVPL